MTWTRVDVLHAAAMALAIPDNDEATEACPHSTHMIVQKRVGKPAAPTRNGPSFRLGPHHFENLMILG